MKEPRPGAFLPKAAAKMRAAMSYYELRQAMPAATSRITIEPGKRGGKPCIRGLRITVWDILGWLGAGMSEEQILDEHPDLEKADFPAVYRFAAASGRRTSNG